MKTLIIYYSYSGNTKKVAEYLRAYLEQKGRVDIIELKAQDEANSFFGQCRRAFRRARATIEPLNCNFSDYDLICFGSPVWAFAPAPAINTCLDQAQNIQGKEIILFTTFGSGTGNTRCLNYMQKILADKGVRSFKRFSVQQCKVGYREFVDTQIQTVFS